MLHDFMKVKSRKSRPVMSAFILISGIFISSFIVTQLIAAELTEWVYIDEQPLFTVSGVGFYNPFLWIYWTLKYINAPLYPNASAIIQYYTPYSLAILGVFAAFSVWLGRQVGVQGLHGTARFATYQEVKKNHLLGKEGVYVGGILKGRNIHYLRHSGPEHVFVFAPTRSAKGVSLVLPTLLSWPQSAVVLDIKRELYYLTAGWREKEANNKIIRFDPSVETSDRYNPLSAVRWGTNNDVSDVQNLVKILTDPDGKIKQDFWQRSGVSFLTGVILHLGYTALNEGKEASLSDVGFFLDNPSMDILDTLLRMKSTEHNPDGRYDALNWAILGEPTTTHPIVAAAAQSMINLDDEPRSSVIQTANSFFDVYKNPIIARNIATSDFTLDDIMNGAKPISLYMMMPPKEQERIFPLFRVLITQMLHHYTGDLKFENGRAVADIKHRSLWLLDEFTSLGKLPVLEKSIAYMAGYGMKLYLICQSLTQLYRVYTRDEGFTDNCHIKVAFAPGDIETARLLSAMCGTTTIIKKQKNISHRYSTGKLLKRDDTSVSMQEVSRPLLTPDECMRLPGAVKDSEGDITEPGDMLVFIAGQNPIYGKQTLYFADKEFTRRSLVARYGEPEKIELKKALSKPTPSLRSFFDDGEEESTLEDDTEKTSYDLKPPPHEHSTTETSDDYAPPTT